MKAGIVLQARMGSTRLPGKVLKPLCGRPMLAHILDRLAVVRRADAVVLATSGSPADDVLAGPGVFRGSESDVLDRYVQAARAFRLDLVVRCTADNPLVDPLMLDVLIETHAGSKADLTHSKTDRGNALPIGAGAEAYTREALERAWREGLEPHHREHVDEYIHEHPELFRIENLPVPPERRAPGLRLTVDTPEDFERMGRIYEALYRPGAIIDLPEAIAWCRAQGWTADA
jgi:spore coat polysaccharide biosynthesis protein SpsF